MLMFADRPHVKYLGCFVDTLPRKLERNMGDSNTNTPTECLNRCKTAGYIYAGVQVHTAAHF